MKCKDCGHLKQVTLAKELTCDIGRELDRLGWCPEFYSGYIERILTGER